MILPSECLASSPAYMTAVASYVVPPRVVCPLPSACSYSTVFRSPNPSRTLQSGASLTSLPPADFGPRNYFSSQRALRFLSRGLPLLAPFPGPGPSSQISTRPVPAVPQASAEAPLPGGHASDPRSVVFTTCAPAFLCSLHQSRRVLCCCAPDPSPGPGSGRGRHVCCGDGWTDGQMNGGPPGVQA